MPPPRKKPCTGIIKCLNGTEFASGLFSPWLCELRQDSLLSFCDVTNRLIKRLEVFPEIYSFFPDSPLTDHLVESKKRQDSFEPLKVTNGTASVICIDNMWSWDPISAVSAYFRSASVIDQVLTRLPCFDDGHNYVDWRQLSKSRDFPSLQMILATTTSDAGRQLLEDLFLCHKQAEEIKLLQMALIEVALNLNAADVDKLMKSSEPFKIIPRAVFNALCQRKRYDYLPVIELAVAVAQVSETSNSTLTTTTTATTTVDGLLRRYENALMLSHCEDAASDAFLLTDDDALKNCRPILLNAIRDASQLPNPDDVLLVLIRLIWLLPSRGCNPNSKANATLIKAIDSIFINLAVSSDALASSPSGRFLNAHKQESLGYSLLATTYRRHLLPAYRESVRNTGFPQMIPPVVQMFRDLAHAHHEPSMASSALQSLRHRLISSSGNGDSDADNTDPSLFSNVSKLISMSGIGVGRRAPQPYSPKLVILVVYGSMTWGLAREIVDSVTRNLLEPLEVLIVCNYLLRGLDIFQQCLS